MNKHYKKLLIVLAILFVILGSFILYLSIPFMNGKTMVLATRPIDPIDPFRGQYIIISYDISRLPARSDVENGQEVYIILAKDEKNVWRYQSVSLTKPTEGDFIKGTVQSAYGDAMWVEYGIEQYFFEKGASFSTQDLTVEVKVSSAGQARITRLLHEGKPVEIAYREPGVLS